MVRHQHDPIVFGKWHRQQRLDTKVHTSVVHLEDIEVGLLASYRDLLYRAYELIRMLNFMATDHIQLAFQFTDGSGVACDAQPGIERDPLASGEVILLNNIAVDISLELSFEKQVYTGGDRNATRGHGDSISWVVWIHIDAREVFSPCYLHV